ncbi:hypothetical protein HPB51_005327 [Rhipicephalus microplus]|uniref:Uncharacterized protein n=1 Tax=Rhipicephalus microplus TaxID=6941 RepID=A0A9J6EXZ5_RHIMP|nr:hypothetical protein HPB51_005327 [Rhipicephalus microplus]
MAEGDASVGGNADLGEIDLTWMDKLRKMVSSDAEWEAIILKKMEEKRNRGDVRLIFFFTERTGRVGLGARVCGLRVLRCGAYGENELLERGWIGAALLFCIFPEATMFPRKQLTRKI